MLAKKFALGFGLAVLLPFLIYYGVSTFSPPPKWDYQTERYQFDTKNSPLTKEEFAQRKAEYDKYDKDYQAKHKEFQQHLFFVAAPIGLIALIAGSFVSVQAVGTGLMFGGVFTFLEGVLSNWSEIQDSMKFGLLLITFAILILIGYKKLSPRSGDIKST